MSLRLAIALVLVCVVSTESHAIRLPQSKVSLRGQPTPRTQSASILYAKREVGGCDTRSSTLNDLCEQYTPAECEWVNGNYSSGGTSGVWCVVSCTYLDCNYPTQPLVEDDSQFDPLLFVE